jgi:hypothetical protein
MFSPVSGLISGTACDQRLSINKQSNYMYEYKHEHSYDQDPADNPLHYLLHAYYGTGRGILLSKDINVPLISYAERSGTRCFPWYFNYVE